MIPRVSVLEARFPFDGDFSLRFWQGIRVVRSCIVLFEIILVAKFGVGLAVFVSWCLGFQQVKAVRQRLTGLL